MSDQSDTHWDSSTVSPKNKDLPKEALGAYKTARLYVRPIAAFHKCRSSIRFRSTAHRTKLLLLQSCFVKAKDGTKLAVDVMLPKDKPTNSPLPCVMFQARYAQDQLQRHACCIQARSCQCTPFVMTGSLLAMQPGVHRLHMNNPAGIQGGCNCAFLSD